MQLRETQIHWGQIKSSWCFLFWGTWCHFRLSFVVLLTKFVVFTERCGHCSSLLKQVSCVSHNTRTSPWVWIRTTLHNLPSVCDWSSSSLTSANHCSHRVWAGSTRGGQMNSSIQCCTEGGLWGRQCGCLVALRLGKQTFWINKNQSKGCRKRFEVLNVRKPI